MAVIAPKVDDLETKMNELIKLFNENIDKKAIVMLPAIGPEDPMIEPIRRHPEHSVEQMIQQRLPEANR